MKKKLFLIHVTEVTNKEYKNKQIIEFYNGCKLYKEQHRLSYLLMYLESLKTVYKGNDFVYSRITQICEKLKKAFNHSILQ